MPTISVFLGILQVLAVSASFLDGIGGPQDKIVARLPQADNGALLCSDIAALFSDCDAETPGIFSMASTDVAGCLCYSSSSWVPNIFDAGVSSCADYASTALAASDYSLASAFEGFCTAVGDYQGSPQPGGATTPPIVSRTASNPSRTPSITSLGASPTITPPTTLISSASGSASGSVGFFTNPACSYVGFALSFCNSASPGFSTMDVSSQAPCLCYSSTVWEPDFFDGAVKTCADFVSTAQPSVYTDFVALEGFCSSVGDVENAAGSGVASATGGSSRGGGGGIGLTVPGRQSSTPAQTPVATVTATPNGPSQSAAVTTIKSGDAAPLNDLTVTWASRLLVFVAVSVMVLL